MLVFDGHLDLAMNALGYDRDQTWSIEALRQREAGHGYDDHRGVPMVTLAEMRRGGVRCCVATLFARAAVNVPIARTLRRSDSDHASPMISAAVAQGQLAYYRLLETRGLLTIITSERQLDLHTQRPSEAIGCIVLMEGADPMLGPEHVPMWHAAGVRVVSLTHTEATEYAGGNATDMPLTSRGVELLAAMREAGMILDLSHLCDRSLFAAVDAFDGPILASHSNCRAVVPGHRQITDEQIKLIAARGGVIGVAIHVGMLAPGNRTRHDVTLNDIAIHIDHICQLTGSPQHAAIGSDLDGGYGLDRVPTGIDSIADLAAVAQPLRQRGYRESDIAAILGGNWLRFYQANL